MSTETDPFYANLDGELPTTVRYAKPGEHFEPVEIVCTRTCHYKAKVCKACGKPKSNKVHTPKRTATCEFKRQNGCARCGAPKKDPSHLGAPESLNVFGSGDPMVWQGVKQRWEEALAQLLEGSDLPRGLERVTVEGFVSFGDAIERDQGNHRVVIEKALGDTLVREGYLAADTWSHYSFGNLELEENGRNEIRLVLFPTAPPVPPKPDQAAMF